MEEYDGLQSEKWLGLSRYSTGDHGGLGGGVGEMGYGSDRDEVGNGRGQAQGEKLMVCFSYGGESLDMMFTMYSNVYNSQSRGRQMSD